ncbi:hypothetical protein [Gorillibacterium sp. sgz500922]|uniref:hypothetical protein n=1 Tax=Gorillibacterium sp. sgz500922 TaxID=3446694 RepID=UPI003F673791
MNHHDQARKDHIVKALADAKEAATTAELYLDPTMHQPDEIEAIHTAADHIDQALAALGALAPAEF